MKNRSIPATAIAASVGASGDACGATVSVLLQSVCLAARWRGLPA